MTRVYFVRHAQPEHDWEEDRTRPLTEEGKKDSAIVLGFLKDKKIDAFYCSPYKRSMDTIAEAADFFTIFSTAWTPMRFLCVDKNNACSWPGRGVAAARSPDI